MALRIPQLVVALLLMQLLACLGQACCATHEPTIDGHLEITEWCFLGPFSLGPREGIISLLTDPEELTPDSTARYPSTLVPGGFTGWEMTEPDSSGWVSMEFRGVPWDTLMDVYGYAGILNGAYAYAEIAMSTDRPVLVTAEHISSFSVNGRIYPGDPYGQGFVRVPVILRTGTNRIRLKLTGYGDHRFRFALEPATHPVITLDDFTVPDLRSGETGSFWVGIPFLNCTPTWIREMELSLGENRFFAGKDTTITDLAPLCVKKVPLSVQLRCPPDSGRTAAIPLKISYEGAVYRDTMVLRIRQPEQSFKRTFVSAMDRSCQYYAVLPPRDFSPDRHYGLILTLHGANVKAEGQVEAYKPKTWAFVVAPTNRRPYGFDWQDWGRLDALEVLEVAKATLPIDSNRVYLTGHSMGGHGVWHVGLTHPDLFAAMAPAAGWTCFELYVPWFLQKAYVFGEPAGRSARELALRQDWPHLFVENARNLPIFVLQGGADDNVPPFHARLLVQRLEELGYPYRYKEDPGRGHWWSIDSLEVSCVDDPDLMGFLRDKERDRFPAQVVLKTTSVAHCSRAYWLEILQQERLYRESRLEGQAEGNTVTVTAENVRQLRLTLAPELVPPGPVTVFVNGRRWSLPSGGSVVTFSKRGGDFRLGVNLKPGLRKTAQLHGPIKQATFSPFVLVYGTQGDSSTTDLLLHQARQEAFRWWQRANGLVEVLADTEITNQILGGYNLILFGGPGENTIVSGIERHLPLRPVGGDLTLGRNRITGSIAAVFVCPNPLNRDRLVVVHQGSDLEALRFSTFFTATYAGAGLPDFLVFDEKVKALGWGGIIAAGFFDSAWDLDDRLMYLGDCGMDREPR